MSICRSFFIPQNTRDGIIKAPVEKFLGVVFTQGGALLMARCAGAPAKSGTQLLDARGHAVQVATGDEPEWHFHLRLEGEEAPPGAEYVGGASAADQAGNIFGIFIFVAHGAPKDAE